ncbi:MAG: glycosyltransferase family 2 protein [Chloroflexi bacterium]|nr:glycosyltransferase family 2 protein [Chloroflexota bacterium]
MPPIAESAGFKTVGIVIPVYNEEDALQAFHSQLCETIESLPYKFVIYYVNDGSVDRTGELLYQISCQDPRVTTIELSRNFGHQAALTAGMDVVEGDFVITMDGDGQHPPALIPAMLELAESGYDLVLTQRSEEENVSFFKRKTASLFYGLINRIGDTEVLPGGADFRLMSRTALDSLKQMREYHRFLRGMVSWIGFRTVILPYTPPARLGGQSKFTLKKMFRLATNAIFSFSLVPLYIGISMGVLMLLLAAVEIIYVLSLWLNGDQSTLAPGWSSLMFVILFASGVLMILLGFIGVYIGFIFQEVKRRPIYLIRQVISSKQSAGIDLTSKAPPKSF